MTSSGPTLYRGYGAGAVIYRPSTVPPTSKFKSLLCHFLIRTITSNFCDFMCRPMASSRLLLLRLLFLVSYSDGLYPSLSQQLPDHLRTLKLGSYWNPYFQQSIYRLFHRVRFSAVPCGTLHVISLPIFISLPSWYSIILFERYLSMIFLKYWGTFFPSPASIIFPQGLN